MDGIRIAVCDDEEEALGLLSHEIRRVFSMRIPGTVVEKYQDEKKLFSRVAEGEKYDVIFLDIDMPHMDGIHLAMELRRLETTALIIFVTNLEGHVFQSFAAKPFRFIRKSHFREEIEEAADGVVKELVEADQGILFRNGRSEIRLNPYRIVYVESQGKNLDIYYGNRRICFPGRMTDMEEKLKDYGFLRVHKGYLVNYRAIYQINAEDLTLDDQTHIPVSRLRMQQVKNEFRRWTL